MTRQPEIFKPVTTRAEDPALLLYSNDAGLPVRGTLLAHHALLGALPGFVASQQWFPQGAEVFWTPLDWAHPSALLCGVLPALYFGRAILGVRGATTPGLAQQLLERYPVSHALVPGALLRQFKLNTLPELKPLRLRSIAIMDEALEEALAQWSEQHFGFKLNHLFGNIEMPALIGESHQKWTSRTGSLGKAFPGHRVAVLKEDGSESLCGDIGELAVHRFDPHGHPDPAVPLRLWRTEAEGNMIATQEWWRTGELVRIDSDGFVWHEGRKTRSRSA
jgi:acetyl-CoA synthetase